MPSLSERALLVTLKISQWTARKLDRQETTALNRHHGLTVEAARVNKNLLPFAVKLERVHEVTGMVRRDFASRTLPWGIDGINILKSTAYMEFTGVVRDWHSQWEDAVGEFIESYPQSVDEAKTLLNGLFKQDWRVDVGDQERERLKAAITAQVAEAEHRAMGEAWQRVHTLVQKAYDRLKDPDTIFRDSLVENARELCALLPALNLTDDPNLERVRQTIEGSLASVMPDTLRSDVKVRQDVADKMADVMSKMGGYFRQ